MASIYNFTSSILHRYRGQVSTLNREAPAAHDSPAKAAGASCAPHAKATSHQATPASLRPKKRAPLAAVHCINAQATPSLSAVAGASAACDRLEALSLRPGPLRRRAHDVPKIELHLVPDSAPADLDVAPIRGLQLRNPTPPSSDEGAVQRRRTLRPSRPAFPRTQFTLLQAQEQAALAVMAQKLRLGLSRTQSAGTPDGLLLAMAQVEAAAGSDAHLTPAARQQLVTLLLYLGDLADGSEAVTAAEAFKHIEELSALLA